MARQLASLLPHLLLLAAVPHLLPHVVSAAVPPSSTTSPQNDNVKPGCQQSTCGNVSIPYPFGIGASCYKDASFSITCNGSTPTLGHGNIELVSINLTDGVLVANNLIAHDCYDQEGNRTEFNGKTINITSLKNYKFSHDRNRFIAVGCDTYAYLGKGKNWSEFWTGCSMFCSNKSDVPDDGTCSGIGCCSTFIPKDLRAFRISVHSYQNHTMCGDFNPCGFAFATDMGFNFTRTTLTKLQKVKKVHITLDWAIMGQNCAEAQTDMSAFACVSPHSDCFNSPNGPGYLCNCSKGFHGNPYLTDGCKDIDECNTPTESPCALVRKCKNFDGGFSCSCPWYMYGDGMINGSGCKFIVKIVYIALGAGFGLLVAISVISWAYYAFRKKRMMELKEKFFRQNGGLLLKEQRHSLGNGRSSAVAKLFSLEDIQAATDNYSISRILGDGGAGTVYRGVLPGKTVVAVKKAKVPNELEVEQFINEVNVLSHINHRNVVRLLGCCLEDQVPVLIYEFVPNGTLSHHIHGDDLRGSLSLHHRLVIAAQVAGALSYLHSAASVPIIHRDVKTTNILLDDNLAAKVSDFGASRLVPLDQNGLVSLVRGTFGYLDPEYFLTGQFTDRSDVYSFGVVFVELLTGAKPIDKSRHADRRNLAAQFTMSVDSGRLFEVMESRVREEGTPELLAAAAELAKRCLRVNGESRPSMKEVAMELEGLKKLACVHPWVEEVRPEEAEHLLEEGNRSSATEPGFSDRKDSFLIGMVPLDITR